jgi:hypothetical protein
MMVKFTPYPGWRFRFDESGVAHHEERTDVKFVIAYGPWRWFLNSLGCAAITMPWRRVYVLREHRFNQSLLRHELVHIEQIEREGPVMFSIKYLYWLIRYGYRENPFEREAYAKEPITEN